MSRLSSIRHEFAEFVPKELEEGVLYISIPYNTVVHRCACGCGSKITTPISPARWQLAYDGETVSLWPSVGNWSYPCQSHYWIRRDRIEWAARWSREKIEAGRERDRLAREKHYKSRAEVTKTPTDRPAEPRQTLMRKLRNLLGR